MRRSLLTILLVLLWVIAAAAQTVTVTTANIEHGNGTDSAFNPSRQITKLMASSPDLIGVQERTTGETAWDAPMASAGLAQAVYLENDANQGDGPAIWYKTSTVTVHQTWSTPLQTTNLISWDGSTTVNKSAVAARVTVGGKQFYFVATHLCWSKCADSNGSQFSVQRVGQIKTLLTWITTTLTGGLDVVIAADFNYSPEYPRESTFTADASTDVLTVTAHGWASGAPITVRNSGGALPTGLSASTTYYVRDVTTNTLNLAATPGGTAINITSNGSGTNFIAGFQRDLFTSAGFADLWITGIANGTATTPWNDRDTNSVADMTPADIGTQTTGTRTHDTRRIDSIYLLRNAGNIALQSITVPDARATCSTTLTTNGTFKECPDITDSALLWDVTDDQGVRVSDHNFMTATFSAGPTASLSCPSTAFVDEPVVCDGSASTGVNGQVGWSTRALSDGRPAVRMNYGDNLGRYSEKRLLKAPHAYRSAGTYTVTLQVWDSFGASNSTTASITVSNVPAATGGNIQPLTDQGSNSANCIALQNAIDTAFGANTVEKEIHLPAITYTCGLTVPAAFGTKYVTIRPTNVGWLPAAQVRVSPALASNMPKIQSPGVDQIQLTIGGAGRGFLRLIGIEFNKSVAGHLYQFIQIGSGATSYAEIPHNIIVKHCYLHGNAFDNTTRAIFINAEKFSLLDSYIEDIHAVGEEAQGVSGFAGSGIVIDNNYIVGLSQGILFGGADAGVKFQATCTSGTSSTGCTLNSAASARVGDGISLPVAGGRGPWSASIIRSIVGNAVTWDQITNQAGTPTAPDTTSNAVRFGASPQDIQVTRNHFFKSLIYKCTDNPVDGQPCIPDPSYNGSYKPVVKNIFELKHAMRVVVTGNVMQNHWGKQGQPGPSVLFTPRNQTCYLLAFPHDPVTCPEQTNPWAMVRDVEFEDNQVLNVADWIDIIGTDNLNPPGTGDEAGPSAFTQYIRAANNLVITNATGMNGGGAMAFIFPGARHIYLSHNTIDDTSEGGFIWGSTAAPIGTTSSDVYVVNSIFKHREYGFIADGNQAASFMSTFFPDGKATYNVITNEQSLVGGENWSTAQVTPNYFPASMNSSIFVNRAGGDYRVLATSPFKAGGATPSADGADMGANIDNNTTATANAVSGNWASPSVTVCKWSLPACQSQ